MNDRLFGNHYKQQKKEISTVRCRHLPSARSNVQRYCLKRSTDKSLVEIWQIKAKRPIGISVLLLSLLLASCAEEKASGEFLYKPETTLQTVKLEPESVCGENQCFITFGAADEAN